MWLLATSYVVIGNKLCGYWQQAMWLLATSNYLTFTVLARSGAGFRVSRQNP